MLAAPVTATGPARAVDAGALVVPAAIRAGHQLDGPRFADDVWDVSGFLPRTAKMTRIDFTTIADPGHARTIREYLHSRLNRGIAVNQLSGTARPMKLTSLYFEFAELRLILRELAAAGATRLADVTPQHLDQALAAWKHRPDTAAGKVGVIKYLAAHGPFLTDRLGFTPWPGRPANQVAGRRIPRENTTPRIPQEVTAPLLQAALFYVQTAAGDLLAAQREISALQAARAQVTLRAGEARARLEAFLAERARADRGIPAAPHPRKIPGAVTAGGIVQAPNRALIGLLAGIPGPLWYHHARLVAAGDEPGYEQGGLNTAMSPWPGPGRPWRPRLDTASLRAELFHLRTACWIVIAYLSGMRDTEVRELARDCAFTEPGPGGRTRYKLRSRVFKDRGLAGGLRRMGRPGRRPPRRRRTARRQRRRHPPVRLLRRPQGRDERQHADPPQPVRRPRQRPADTARRRAVHPRPRRRPGSLAADHHPVPPHPGLAHRPPALRGRGRARQYKHAQVTIFEGYAGTSASGFAAEVEAEQAVARLDYAEDLYRDWLAGGPSGGGADHKINAEFARIHAELADLPGTIADPRRLRTMLSHLVVTLHPGVLGDCFYQPGTALCAKQARPPAGKKPRRC